MDTNGAHSPVPCDSWPREHLAHKGTLFLDEITTLNPALQSKLLRVLQEHSIQRLGGRTTKKIDFRLITATNDDLGDSKGDSARFPITESTRQSSCCLRDRGRTSRLWSTARLYCSSPPGTGAGSIEILEYWPGNVRELENVVQRLVLMSDGPSITAYHLPQQLLYSTAASQEAILIPEDGVDFDAEMERIQVAYLNAAPGAARESVYSKPSCCASTPADEVLPCLFPRQLTSRG